MKLLTASDARAKFREVLQEASTGNAVAVARGRGAEPGTAIVELDRLVQTLRLVVAPRLEVLLDDDTRWLAIINGSPLVGEGDTVEEAVDDLVDALAEYAEDWERLRHAPNHAQNWVLVQLSNLSEPDDLAQWVLGVPHR